MTEQKPKKKMHWGYGIAFLYGGFVIFTLSIVGYASFQHFDLVDQDYYAKGIDYQRQLERIKRADALTEKPRYEFLTESQEVLLHFPHSFQTGDVTGTLTFFRPSAASMDLTVPVKLDSDFTQRVKSDRLAAGLWRVKLQWSVAGKDFYNEQELMLR